MVEKCVDLKMLDSDKIPNKYPLVSSSDLKTRLQSVY